MKLGLSPRNSLIAVAVGLLLLVIVLVVVLIVPQFAKLSDLGMQIDKANEDSAAAKTLLEQRLAVKNRAAMTSGALLRLATAVPENPELPSLIIELQDVAYASGVAMREVTPQPPVGIADKQYVKLDLKLEVWGTWADTVDFMQRLDKMGRELRVGSFKSAVLEEGPATDAKLDVPPYYQTRTEINVSSYTIPAPSTTESAAPAPAPAPTE